MPSLTMIFVFPIVLALAGNAWAGPARAALDCALETADVNRLVTHMTTVNTRSPHSDFGGGHTPQALEDLSKSGKQVEYKNLNGYYPNGTAPPKSPPLTLTLPTPNGPQKVYVYTVDVVVDGRVTKKTIMSPSELQIKNMGKKMAYTPNPAFEAALHELTGEAMATATTKVLTPEFLQFAKANPTAKPFRVAVSVNVGGKQVPFVLLVGDKTVNDAIAAEKAGRALAVDSVQFNSLFPGRPFPGDAGVVFRP